MRCIILFILIIFSVVSTLGQVPVKKEINKAIPDQVPSKAEMQKQLADAKKQSLELTADLEQQIAEAKANGDDTEKIQEMENRLATLRRISGIIEKVPTNPGRPQNIPKTKYPVVKYVSPIVPLVVKQPYKVPTEKEAKDSLLWYRGKKIDNTTLVTTAGMVIRYDRLQNRVIVRPDAKKDTVITLLVKKLSKTETIKNDFANTTNQIKNSFFMFPEIMAAYEEFDYIRKRYDRIANNTIDFPDVPIVRNSRLPVSSGFGYGGAIMLEAIMLEELNNNGLEQAYQELMGKLNNPPGLNVTTPPKRPNDLCLCDPARRAQYENELDNWLETLWEYENDLLSKLKNLHRHLEDNSAADLSSMPTIHADLQRALDLAMSRKQQKVNLIYGNWEQDVLREEALVMARLTLERELQKIGRTNSSGSGHRQTFNDNFLSRDNQFGQFIRNEMDAKNYNVVFDYSLYLSHEYHKQLLGGTPNVNITRYFKWQATLMHYNRFTMTIDMDFDVEWRGTDGELHVMLKGELSSDPMKVSIGRMGCKWQLFLTFSNYLTGDEMDFRIPFKAKGGEKKIKMQNMWNTYPYSGPRDLLMVFPSVRMDFCPGGGSDSAIMDVLRYKNDIFNQQWVNVAGMTEEELGEDPLRKDPLKKYVIELLLCANKLLIPAETAKQRHAEMASIGDEMLDFNSGIRLDNPTGNSVMDELKIEYSSNLRQHNMQKKLADAIHTNQSYILFDAVNNSDLLIEKNQPVEYDQLEIKEKMKRGNIILRVKHTPSPRWQFGPDRI